MTAGTARAPGPPTDRRGRPHASTTGTPVRRDPAGSADHASTNSHEEPQEQDGREDERVARPGALAPVSVGYPDAAKVAATSTVTPLELRQGRSSGTIR